MNMSRFRQMVVIPQEEYVQLKSSQNTKQPLSQLYQDTLKEYNENANIIDPYKRLITQSENLEELKSLKDQMRNYLSVVTPKPYRHRAQSLLQSIEPYVKFNDRGEILDDNNQVIENSRIDDLIQHAVRDRRRNITPRAWNYFVSILKKHNIPKTILNRNTLDEIEDSNFIRKENTLRNPILNIKTENTEPILNIKKQTKTKRKGLSIKKETFKKQRGIKKVPVEKRYRISNKKYPDKDWLKYY